MAFFQELVDGYRRERAKTNPPSLPRIEQYSVDDHKDYMDGTPSLHLDSEAQPVRTNTDVLDFLQYVVEETREWIEREAGEGHAPPMVRGKPMVLRTAAVPANDFKVNRFTATAAECKPLAHRRDDRTLIRFVNYGPEIVYAAHESFSPGNLPQPNTITIPVSDPANGKYYPVEFPTRDEVWCASGNAAGGTAVVEVTDFYGHGGDS